MNILKVHFSVHQWHVISLLIHGFLSVNTWLLIALGTAFYAIIANKMKMSSERTYSFELFVIFRYRLNDSE